MTGANAGRPALDELKGEEIPPEAATLRSAAFNLLLESGRPITNEEIAARSGLSPDAVAEILSDSRARGRARFDDEGRLVGVAGLSIVPTRHVIEVNGTTRWTWCALDAVGILGALGVDGSIRSVDPSTGEPISIGFRRGAPDDDATLFILGGFKAGNIVNDWCPLVNFFSDEAVAAAWAADNGLEGDIVAVAAVAAEIADIWRRVVDPASPRGG